MAEDWKKRLGVVYSTNPDFRYDTEEDDSSSVETLSPDRQKLRVSLERKGRAGKQVTIVGNFVGKDEDLENLARMLKQKCGVGGSCKDGEIIIQGDFRERITSLLADAGYTGTKRGN